MTDKLIKTGSFTVEKDIKTTLGNIKTQVKGNVSHLRGMLNHIQWVDNFERQRKPKNKSLARQEKSLKKQIPLNSREITHRNFLFYTRFYANQKASILFEGITDKIYLKLAIKNSKISRNKLYFQNELKVDFFTPSENTNRLLSPLGGAGSLKNFLVAYTQWTHELRKKLSAPTNHPIIVIVDNDAAGKGVLNAFPKRKDLGDYYEIHENLYVIPLPQVNSQPTFIEHYLPDSVLSTTLGGKPFDITGNKPKTTHYGKVDLATKIVLPSTRKIDFSGFDPLLDIIDKLVK